MADQDKNKPQDPKQPQSDQPNQPEQPQQPVVPGTPAPKEPGEVGWPAELPPEGTPVGERDGATIGGGPIEGLTVQQLEGEAKRLGLDPSAHDAIKAKLNEEYKARVTNA